MSSELEKDRVKIVRTLLEMMRDRGYTFRENFDVDGALADLEKGSEIPFINSKVDDSADLPRDIKGMPVYVYIQDGDENLHTFADNQPDRQAMAKQISYLLRSAFPDMSNNKKISDFQEQIHLILVLNITKREMIRFEEEALNIYNLEVWPKYRLRFNVSKHELVGKYTKLTPEEFEDFKNKFQLTALTIPKIMLDDPPIRYFYGQPGDCFHIEGLRGHVSFRMVVRKTIHAQNKKKA